MGKDNGEWLEPYNGSPDAAEQGRTVRILPDSSPRAAYRGYEPEQSAQSRPDSTESRQPVQPATPPAKRRNSPSACIVIAATFALLTIACGLLAYATIQGGVSGLGKLTGILSLPNISLVTTPTVTIDTSQPAVIDRVRALSKLETVHYQVEKVITGKSSGPLPDVLTSDKILLVAHGEVVAGIDLSKLQDSDVQVVSNTVTMTLPQPEILYSKLDNSKTYVYDRQTGIFSKPDPNLESQVRQAAEQQIVQAAMEDGILNQATTNAQAVLRALLSGLGYRDVNFK
jgi:hypothetical protein